MVRCIALVERSRSANSQRGNNCSPFGYDELLQICLPSSNPFRTRRDRHAIPYLLGFTAQYARYK